MADVALSLALEATNNAKAVLDSASGDLRTYGGEVQDVGKKLDGATLEGAQFKEALEEIGKIVDDTRPKFGSLSEGLFEAGDAGGNFEQLMNGVSDSLGFVSEQFGISVGPLQEYAGMYAQLGGGMEAVLKGGPALVAQIGGVAKSLPPAIAGSWAYVTALYAQAAAFIVANAPIILLVAGLALLVGAVILVVKNWDVITAKFPILGTMATTVKDALLGLASGAEDMGRRVFNAAESVLNFFRDNWKLIAVLISGPFFPIVALATDAFGVRTALVGAFTAIRDKAVEIIGEVTGFFSGIPGSILGAVSDIFDAANAVGGAIASGIANGVKGILNFAGDMGGYVRDALRGAMNQAMGWLADNVKISIPGFDPPGPGSIPGFDWNFPRMSFNTGGIVPGAGVGRDIVPALLTPGEGVFTREQMAAMGGAARSLVGTVIIQTLDAAGMDAAVETLLYKLDKAAKGLGGDGLV